MSVQFEIICLSRAPGERKNQYPQFRIISWLKKKTQEEKFLKFKNKEKKTYFWKRLKYYEILKG